MFFQRFIFLNILALGFFTFYAEAGWDPIKDAKKIGKKIEKEINRTDENLHKITKKTGKAIEQAARDVRDEWKRFNNRESETVPGIKKQVIEYKVDKTTMAPDWLVSFKQITKIRHHSTSEFAPYLLLTVDPMNNVIVKPGQWLELLDNNSWYLMSDADYR